MNTAASIATQICPLLNHLLVTIPYRHNGGLDFGWFCREHALITKVVLNHSGVECEIVRGDVLIYIGGQKRLTTVDTGSDHVWCACKELLPLDLSMTFRHFPGYPNFNPPVLGCQGVDHFTVTAAKDEAMCPAVLESGRNTIVFIQKTALAYSSRQYIDRPTILLEHDEAGRISLAIANYVIDLRSGMKPIVNVLQSQDESLATILDRYPNPKKRLRQLFQK